MLLEHRRPGASRSRREPRAPKSERIPEAQEQYHRALRRVALAVELPAELGAQRADRRQVAEAEAGARLEPFRSGQPDVPPVRPDVAGVEKQGAAQSAEDGEAIVA